MRHSSINRVIKQYESIGIPPMRRIRGGSKHPAYDMNNRMQYVFSLYREYNEIVNMAPKLILSFEWNIIKSIVVNFLKGSSFNHFRENTINRTDFIEVMKITEWILDKNQELLNSIDVILKNYDNVDDKTRLRYTKSDIIKLRNNIEDNVKISNLKRSLNNIKKTLLM